MVAGAISLKKPYHIITLRFSEVVKDHANYFILFFRFVFCFQRKRKKPSRTMPNNNNQGAANNQVSFLRNKLNFEKVQTEIENLLLRKSKSLMFDEDGENVVRK